MTSGPIKRYRVRRRSFWPDMHHDVKKHVGRCWRCVTTKACRDQTSETVAITLQYHWFVHYGLPTRIHSDQGRSFEGALIQNLRKCKWYATKKSRTTALHPNGNGQCEHSNKTLWLVTFCRSKGEETMARINQTCTAHPQLYSSHGNWSDAISFDVWPRALVSNWAPVE